METAERSTEPLRRHTAIPLAALHAIEATRSYFEAPQEGEAPSIELTKHEKTAEGFIELGWEHLETQRSLHLDLRYACEGPFASWPRVMQDRAHEAIDRINIERNAPLDIHTANPTFLFRIAEPRWSDIAISDEAIAAWPEEFHADLEMLHELDSKLRVLSRDETLQKEARELWSERTEVMKVAAGIDHNKQKQMQLLRRITELRMRVAAIPGQKLSTGKLQQIKQLEAQVKELDENEYQHITSEDLIPDIAAEIERRSRKRAHAEYKQGLVMTEPMEAIIHEALPSLIKGNPMLLVGETGGAKTALAKYISRKIMDKEPEIISGYADVNGYQLIGKTGLTTKDGVTVSEFMAGPVIRAMEDGRPLLLDEINAMPPEFLKRLNEITQLRPGDTMSIQEDSGRVVTIQQGFCIISTANEKSKRYAGVQDLSTEFRNRFTANTYRVMYPDANVVTGQDPLDNYRLAYGATCDATGELRFAEGAEVLERFVKACHMTQRLFSSSIRDGLNQDEKDALGPERLSNSDSPGLDENVLAPRTMVALLEKVVDSQLRLKLEDVLERYVQSIKNTHDKAVITTILSTRNLLPGEPTKASVEEGS